MTDAWVDMEAPDEEESVHSGLMVDAIATNLKRAIEQNSYHVQAFGDDQNVLSDDRFPVYLRRKIGGALRDFKVVIIAKNTIEGSSTLNIDVQSFEHSPFYNGRGSVLVKTKDYLPYSTAITGIANTGNDGYSPLGTNVPLNSAELAWIRVHQTVAGTSLPQWFPPMIEETT